MSRFRPRPARLPSRTHTVIALVTAFGVLVAAGQSLAAPTAPSCRPTIIRLPVPDGAVGGRVVAHSGATYVGAILEPNLMFHPALWIHTGGRFVVHDLGLRFGLSTGGAAGVDRAGDVLVFFSAADGGGARYLVYRHGDWRPVRGPAGYDAFGAVAINAAGSLAGFAIREGVSIRAVFWPSWRRRGVVLTGGQQALAENLNERDDLVGAGGPPTLTLPEIWPNARPARQLPMTAPQAEAFAINDHRLISGSLLLANGESDATVWRTPTSTPLDLGGMPGYDQNLLSAVNNRGQAAGTAQLSGTLQHIALYWPGHGPLRTLLPLGRDPSTERSFANGIDDQDTVLGGSDIAAGTHSYPTLWTCAAAQAFVPPTSLTPSAGSQPGAAPSSRTVPVAAPAVNTFGA